MKLIAIAAASFVAFAATPAMAQTVAPTPPDEVQTVDDPKGGYQPTTPLFSSTPAPGATVIFVPNTQTPTEAYPPPAPLPVYPICRPKQFDNCRQRGG